MAEYRLPQNTKKITQRLWEKFVTSAPDSAEEDEAFAEAKSILRPMVFNSWVRSKRHHVDPFTPKTDILPEPQLTEILEANKLLIDVSMPYLQSIYSFLDQAHFSLIITDANGITLTIVGGKGSTAIESLRKEDGIDIGMSRITEYNGTNGIGLCLDEKEPVQITGPEHYVSTQRSWVSSTAPIHDSNGELIGTVSIFGHPDMLHPHTLGMTVTAADGIEKELALLRRAHHLSILNKQLKHTLQFATEGVIMVDEHLTICQHNRMAKSILHLENVALNGRLINDILPMDKNILDYEEFIRSPKDIRNKEISLPGSTMRNIYVSITPIIGDGDNIGGFILALQKTKQIHKIANKIYGSTAIFSFDSIIGTSPPISSCKKMGRIASQSTSNLLILGESGTGKELFAQAVHNASNRASGPFIPVNCASLPKQLIESELFGYEGGAFTGADKNGRTGKFELANGGTIFLDEIGDMPLDVQASLLRVLQSREITRIGSSKSRPIDVRVIAATNHDLEDDVANHLFRSDLFFRLNVLLLSVPPLRERIDDIPLLAESFTEKYAHALNKQITSVSPDAIFALMSYHWPGNVRELENVIERAVNISLTPDIRVQDLPTTILNNTMSQKKAGRPYEGSVPQRSASDALQQEKNIPLSAESDKPSVSSMELRTQERQLIEQALQESGGNVKKAADLLGVSRKTLYNKFKAYEIDATIYRKLNL